jgi:hypothetical protein
MGGALGEGKVKQSLKNKEGPEATGKGFWGQKQFKKGVFLGVLSTFFEEKGRFWRGDSGKLCRFYRGFRKKD